MPTYFNASNILIKNRLDDEEIKDRLDKAKVIIEKTIHESHGKLEMQK